MAHQRTMMDDCFSRYPFALFHLSNQFVSVKKNKGQKLCARLQPRLMAKPDNSKNKTTCRLPINIREKYRKEETPRSAAFSSLYISARGHFCEELQHVYTNPFLFPHTAAHTTAFKLLASCWLRLCRARSSHPVHSNRGEERGGEGSSYLREHMITLLRVGCKHAR